MLVRCYMELAFFERKFSPALSGLPLCTVGVKCEEGGMLCTPRFNEA